MFMMLAVADAHIVDVDALVDVDYDAAVVVNVNDACCC
jgi:hypothetical protein